MYILFLRNIKNIFTTKEKYSINMSQSNHFTKRKRFRGRSSKKSENSTQKEFIINKANIRYYFNLSLSAENSQILIKCGQSNSSFDFEAHLKLEPLQKKCKMFKACLTLQDAYKIFTNLFKYKKVKIKEEKIDSIIIVLYILNYIEDKDEEIFLNLAKIKKRELENSNKLKIGKNYISAPIDNKEKNNNNNLNIELEEKCITLSKNDQDKNIQIKRLENNLIELKNVHDSLLKEIIDLKKSIGFIDKNDDNININIINEDNDEIEECDYKEDENEEKEEETIYKEGKYFKNLRNKASKEYNKKEKSKNKNKAKARNSKIKILKIKEIKNRIDNKSKSIPKMVFTKNLTNKAVCKYICDNHFAVFKTINKEKLLAFATIYHSIHFYNIELEKLTGRITNAHEKEITNIRYSYDKNNNRDLLVTVSNDTESKTIKVWDIQKLTCIVEIHNPYSKGDLYSSCLLIDENYKKNYLITINYDKENLKIFDFDGKIVKEIDNSEDKSFLVDTYYNSKTKKYYIIVCNEKSIVSYNFLEGSIYNKYHDSSANSWHLNFAISSKDKEVNLIECDSSGYVRIWDFNKAIILKKLLIEKKVKLRALCLWNHKYFFVGAEDRTIKLIDLENNVEVDNIKCNDSITTIKKINTSKYGESFVIQGRYDSAQIKLWRNEYSK